MMGKTLILSLSFVFLFAEYCDAQPYQSIFGKNSTSWNTRNADEFGVVNDVIFVIKDTVVNGLSYKTLKHPWYSHSVGMIREDTNTGTVWYKSLIYATAEVIMSRMDLNVGDTFDISNVDLWQWGNSQPISTVDSINYKNGLKHIYFNALCPYNEPFTLIEGVTSNMGVLWKEDVRRIFAAGDYLLCSYKDGQKTAYENIAYNGACHDYSSITNIKAETLISIYPIPASIYLQIDNNSTFSISHIQIYDLTGRVVKEVHGTNINNINIQAIPSGHYFIKLYSDKGYLLSKMITID